MNQNLNGQRQAYKQLKRNLQSMVLELQDFECEFEKEQMKRSTM
jgi:hypothetical protein